MDADCQKWGGYGSTQPRDTPDSAVYFIVLLLLPASPGGARDGCPIPSPAFSRGIIAHIFPEVLKNSLY